MQRTPRPKSAQPSRGLPRPVRGWNLLPLLVAGVFVVAAVGAARRETPTVDEFAHVPAGLLHWRTGQYELYRNNPPLGKMWVALPLAVQRFVAAPELTDKGVGWSPWFYGMRFERLAGERYLSLMTSARLMVVPLVLVTGGLVFVWCRALYGEFAAALASSLFLLSPTVLAHGHLATVDVASTATIFAAVFSLRWSAAAPSWRRDLVAGGLLGLALAVKFSALFLIPLVPLLFAVAAWPQLKEHPWRALTEHLAVYAVCAWLVLNASVGFSGTFDRVDSLEPRSKTFKTWVGRLPGQLPLLLPRPYVEGIDTLKEDIEIGEYAGYLHGEWSVDGWTRYYFVAYALKESEPVVILTVLSLLAFPLVVRDWRERLLVVVPPAVFLFIAAVPNTLCLGIRYVLPVFPFLFVMMGACFAWAEGWLARRFEAASTGRQTRKFDLRWLVAGTLVGYAVALTALVYPGCRTSICSLVVRHADPNGWSTPIWIGDRTCTACRHLNHDLVSTAGSCCTLGTSIQVTMGCGMKWPARARTPVSTR
jgi:hypothetical protein